MERISRALELAFAQRTERAEARVVSLEPVPSTPPAAVDFTETVTYRTPEIALDTAVAEQERILPPGAAGQHGVGYKMLRTQVLRRLDQLGATVLGVVSAGAGEGKTLTAINLAIAIAADPARTALLLDLDLKSPGVGRRFRHEPQFGLEDCLQRRCGVRDTMFKVKGYDRLTIAAARGRSEISSELLASTQAAELVRELRTRYANRIVIVDLPPVLQADDALAFSRNLQAGLFVIGEGKTRRDDVARSLQLLGDVPFVGSVLNGSRERIDAAY